MEEELVTIASTKHGIEGEEVGVLQKMWNTSDCFDVTLVGGYGEQQDVKVCAPKSEIRVTTAMKQEILKNQDRVNIPFEKPMKYGSWFKSNEEQALFKCDECESKFQRENLLGIHKRARHGNQPASPPKKPRKRRSDARPLPVRT